MNKRTIRAQSVCVCGGGTYVSMGYRYYGFAYNKCESIANGQRKKDEKVKITATTQTYY